jgi:hypothetical protein
VNEAEWLAAVDPQPMLDFLTQNDNDPRLRLFACACVRRIWHLLPDDRCKAAVEAAERDPGAKAYPPAVRASVLGVLPGVRLTQVPGQDQPGEWAQGARMMATTAAFAVLHQGPMLGFASGARWAAAGASTSAAGAVTSAARAAGSAGERETKAERAAQSRLLRDIVFNPFSLPPAVEAAWLAHNGGAVPKLARAIRDERAYDRLPLLADALEDAGCSDVDLLGHCRSGAEHALGCWAVEMLRGRGE